MVTIPDPSVFIIPAPLANVTVSSSDIVVVFVPSLSIQLSAVNVFIELNGIFLIVLIVTGGSAAVATSLYHI